MVDHDDDDDDHAMRPTQDDVVRDAQDQKGGGVGRAHPPPPPPLCLREINAGQKIDTTKNSSSLRVSSDFPEASSVFT